MRGLPDKLHLDFVNPQYYCERPRVSKWPGSVFVVYKCLRAFWRFDFRRLTYGLAVLTQLGSIADFGEIMVNS